MKRLVTTSIFGTILGIVGAYSTANASIVSSGFLDEKLTEYALSTSLDLKANQSDFTELNTQISDSIDYLKTLWAGAIGELAYAFDPNKVNNNINGAFGLVGGFLSHSMLSLTDGWTDSNDGKTYLGIKNLNTKIGDLPRTILPSMWIDIPYITEFGENMPDGGIPLPSTLGEQLELLFNGGLNSPIERMFRVMTVAGRDLPVGTIEPGSGNPQAEFLGLNPLTQKVRSIEEIIRLPSGGITPSKGLASLILRPNSSSYPTSIRNFMTDIYTGYWSTSAIADAVYFGNEYTGQKDPALVVKGLRQITDDIGTLPSGKIPVYEFLFSDLNQPPTYPTSLAELITAIYGYGDAETGRPGLLTGIFEGSRFDLDHNGQPDAFTGIIPNFIIARNAKDHAEANAAKIGTVPDGKNLAGMISETDAKIGTLPAGYDSVGAALSAIKGIAEEAKTAALAAIPDPKQEGSSGKYVLTVDIIGDNATYHWEKIDRVGESTTTTE